MRQYILSALWVTGFTTCSLVLVVSARAQDQEKLVARLSPLPASFKTSKTDEEGNDAVTALLLAGLKRLPTDAERTLLEAYLDKAKDRESACQDILWALVNSKEFAQVHGLTWAEASRVADRLAKVWEKK